MGLSINQPINQISARKSLLRRSPLIIRTESFGGGGGGGGGGNTN